jgi:hypothetical protein
MHALPKYFDWLQMYLMLPALLAAEGIINGNMMALGLSGGTPEQEAERIAMFIAGFLMGGMALRCSSTAAAAFQRGEVGFGLFNSIGILLFALPEIWASLVVRSTNLPTTMPDNWLISVLAVQGTQVTPSNIMVSLVLPLVTIFWGFATRKRTRMSAEELKALEEQKLIKARGRAERRKLLVTSVAETAKAGAQSLRGQQESEEAAMSREDTVPAEGTIVALLPTQITPATVAKILGLKTDRAVRDRIMLPESDPNHVPAHKVKMKGRDVWIIEVEELRAKYPREVAKWETSEQRKADMKARSRALKEQPLAAEG